MNKNGIYTITTLRPSLFQDHRCVGFFHEQENAIKAVEHNDGDIYEGGYYPYVVIEKSLPGIYHFEIADIWFRWNRELKCYKSCEKPDNYKRTVCFGVG